MEDLEKSLDTTTAELPSNLNGVCLNIPVASSNASLNEHKRNAEHLIGKQKTINRNVATSGYGSFTDSQLFFGSQFWPENSQSTSQDLSLSSSSQEGSDHKISSSYHTKPLLFGELTGKNRAFGILDKFEEDKKKAKENNDSDLLAKQCQHIGETLSNIQQLVSGAERNMSVCQTVLERFDNFASTLQNNLTGLQSDLSQHFETLIDKVISHRNEMTELEETVKKSADTTAVLGSDLQSLKSSLESLREEQQRERNMLEEALRLLGTLVQQHPAKPSPPGVTDSSIQTSLDPEHSLSNILLNNQSTPLTCAAQSLDQNPVEVPPQKPSGGGTKKKVTHKGKKRRKKRPLVLSRRSKRTVSGESRPPRIDGNKAANASMPLSDRCDKNMVNSQDRLVLDLNCQSTHFREKKSSEAGGCLITPLSFWSQDSNSSGGLEGVRPILEKLSAESSTGKPEGLWQLFARDCDSDSGF